VSILRFKNYLLASPDPTYRELRARLSKP